MTYKRDGAAGSRELTNRSRITTQLQSKPDPPNLESQFTEVVPNRGNEIQRTNLIDLMEEVAASVVWLDGSRGRRKPKLHTITEQVEACFFEIALERVIFAHDISFSRGGFHSLVAVESPFCLAQFRKVWFNLFEIVFHITTYFQTTEFPRFAGMDFLRFAPKQVGGFLPTGGWMVGGVCVSPCHKMERGGRGSRK